MAPVIHPVETDIEIPSETTVVIIGGGIIGISAALVLAERGIPVCVLEKGRIAAEQSSRNLGWVRKMGRGLGDLPLAMAADQLWADMPARVGADLGYRRAGIAYIARNAAEMAKHEAWHASVAGAGLDSRLLSPREIGALAPGGSGNWYGGIYTASDGRAEPTLATSALAQAARAKGAKIIEHCAVRGLIRAGGAVAGVETERGEIRAQHVLLAGGLWSRRFLGNMGVSLPTLPLSASVLRTKPMEGPCETAIGGPDFSFRKRLDGGYTITQRGALYAPLMLDHLKLGLRYLPVLKAEWKNVRLSLGREAVQDLILGKSWKAGKASPFERMRIMDPVAHPGLIREAMANLTAAWPVFHKAEIAQTWAGMIDVTPDSLPVISGIAGHPGLTLATGFSGHGFGTGPAAGQLAADLIMGTPPLVAPQAYAFDRF